MANPSDRNKESGIDRSKIVHDLRAALLNFRTAHEILLDPEPDQAEANLLFQAADERILDIIESITGKRE